MTYKLRTSSKEHPATVASQGRPTLPRIFFFLPTAYKRNMTLHFTFLPWPDSRSRRCPLLRKNSACAPATRSHIR